MDDKIIEIIKSILNKKIDMYEKRGLLDIATAYQVSLELLIYAENGDIDKLERING